jgi:hypothetical protein
MAVAHSGQQIGKGRESERRGDDVRQSGYGQGDDGRRGGAQILRNVSNGHDIS